jgi:hypothetical protein
MGRTAAGRSWRLEAALAAGIGAADGASIRAADGVGPRGAVPPVAARVGVGAVDVRQFGD